MDLAARTSLWDLNASLFELRGVAASFPVQGHELPIRAKVFRLQAQSTDPQELLDALQSGTAEGMPARIRGVDGTPFRVFLDDPGRDRHSR